MQRILILFFALVVLAISAAPARAELVSAQTEAAVLDDCGARETVSAQLVARGAAPDAAAAMADRMTIEEVVYFEAEPSRTQPGGNAAITVLVVVALVILIIVLAQEL